MANQSPKSNSENNCIQENKLKPQYNKNKLTAILLKRQVHHQ